MIRVAIITLTCALLTTACASTEGPARPDVTANGKVTFKADPWAKVTVGGEQIGTTPVTHSLPAGNHDVTFTRLDQSTTRTIMVTAGTSTDVTVDMNGPAAATDTAAPASGVRLRAKPWAKVTVDGKSAGMTPATLALAAGEHTAVFEKGDKTVTKTFTVVDGVPVDILVDLDK